MRPKSEICTPKRDDEHPHSYHMGSPPPPGRGYAEPFLRRDVRLVLRRRSLFVHFGHIYVSTTEQEKSWKRARFSLTYCYYIEPLVLLFSYNGNIVEHKEFCRYNVVSWQQSYKDLSALT